MPPANLFIESFAPDGSILRTRVSAGMLDSQARGDQKESTPNILGAGHILNSYLSLQQSIDDVVDDLTPQQASLLIAKLAPVVGREDPDAARVFTQLAMDTVLRPRAIVGIIPPDTLVPPEVKRQVEAQQRAQALRLEQDARRLRLEHRRVAEAMDLVTGRAGERAARILDGLTIAARQLVPALRVIPKPPPPEALASWLALSDADRDAAVAEQTELSGQCYWPNYYWDPDCHEEDGTRLLAEDREETWTNGAMPVHAEDEAVEEGDERALALARLYVPQNVVTDERLLEILREFAKPQMPPKGRLGNY